MTQPNGHLVRAVGLAGLTAISLNGVIGSGIFVLPATVAALLGPASVLAYLIAALATTLIVLCFAEAGSLFDRTGGPYLYAREAFGRFIGFEVGWMFFLTRLAAAGAISHAFASYLGYFWPALMTGAGRLMVITALLGGLAWLNVRGIRYGAWTVNILTVAKLVPLVLFVSVGLVAAEHSRYIVVARPDMENLRQASLVLIFAFGGFENASVPSEEVLQPRRHVPVALMSAIGVTVVLYLLIQVVALGTHAGLAYDPTPLASAGRNFLGPWGAGFITAGAILSTGGSNSALLLVGPRILYALSEGGQLPPFLARIHPRFRTPHLAVITFALLVWGISLYGSFAELAAMSAMARLLFSVSTCLAVPRLRKRQPEPHSFRLPGGVTIPLLATAISLWLLTGITPSQARAGVLGLGVGALLYLLHRLSPRSPRKK